MATEAAQLADAIDCATQTELARKIADLSIEHWGSRQAAVLVGRDDAMVAAQAKLVQFAQAESPTLITGETGTGKELFARALYLLCARRRRPFISVNCAKFQDSQLLLSELFGHKRGSFTGAVADRPGVFEEANHGVVLLDEIAELSLTAQAMLLRTLGEGEVLRVGENRPRVVDVRIIAATARNLAAMIEAGTFRPDLYYRLRFLRLRIPPLRERGEDWRLTAEYYLHRLNAAGTSPKRLSSRAVAEFQQYHWPGNVRELKGIVELAYHACAHQTIEPEHFLDEFERADASGPASPAGPSVTEPVPPYVRMTARHENFWDAVYEPFMNRDLNRAEVRAIVAQGLRETRGRYKNLLPLFGMPPSDYLKFMDFLRHHRLKPL